MGEREQLIAPQIREKEIEKTLQGWQSRFSSKIKNEEFSEESLVFLIEENKKLKNFYNSNEFHQAKMGVYKFKFIILENKFLKNRIE